MKLAAGILALALLCGCTAAVAPPTSSATSSPSPSPSPSPSVALEDDPGPPMLTPDPSDGREFPRVFVDRITFQGQVGSSEMGMSGLDTFYVVLGVLEASEPTTLENSDVALFDSRGAGFCLQATATRYAIQRFGGTALPVVLEQGGSRPFAFAFGASFLGGEEPTLFLDPEANGYTCE